MVKKQKKSKISNEFLSRLKRIEPDKILRVILLMNFKAKKINRRLSLAERQAIMKKIRRSMTLKIKKIDQILKTFGGKRLASKTDALGCLPVEISVSGIHALAESEDVKAILEDQSIKVLP